VWDFLFCTHGLFLLNFSTEAQHFIYIESQFFISSTATGSKSKTTQVNNKIADALIDRIALAFEQKETFRVYIIVPLHPEGTRDTILNFTFLI
jgi:phospholipase D1/2